MVIFNQIIPSGCRYEVTSTKIEIRLAKAESVHWKSLEFTRETTVAPRAIDSSGNFRFIYRFYHSNDWTKLLAFLC